MLLEQHVVGAGGLAVDPVVGAHDRGGMALDDRGAEGGQVGVLDIVGGDEDVGFVAGAFGAAVDGEMLRGGDHQRPVGVGALHAGDEGDTHACGEERVLAIGFLATPPARVAEDVDVGRPGVEPGTDMADASGLAGERVEAAYLGADRPGDVMHHRGVEAGGEPDGFGEVGGGERAERAVERFGPPIVGGDAEPWDRRCDVEQLGQLFLQRHSRDERRRHAGRRITLRLGRCRGRCRRGFAGEGRRQGERQPRRREGGGLAGDAHDVSLPVVARVSRALL